VTRQPQELPPSFDLWRQFGERQAMRRGKELPLAFARLAADARTVNDPIGCMDVFRG